MDPKLLDRFEKLAYAAAFALLAFRMAAAYRNDGNPAALFYVIDGSILLFFLLIRRSTENISLRPMDWLSGFGATFLPLMVAPPDRASAILSPIPILVLMVAGTTLHLMAKVRLFRSFGIVAANRGVVHKGIYSLVRHPMYLGYMIVESGLLLSGPNLINLAVIAATWGLFILRINAEERILSEDPGYRDFMTRTRYRLLPGVY